MFSERERYALAYALEVAIKEDSQELRKHLDNKPWRSISSIGWDARNLATMGRICQELLETLS